MNSNMGKGKALKVVIAGIDINNDTKTDFNQKNEHKNSLQPNTVNLWEGSHQDIVSSNHYSLSMQPFH